MAAVSRFVCRIIYVPDSPRTTHYLGIPPASSSAPDHRIPRGEAVLLVIKVRSDGIFLHRYAADRSCAGDTWRRTIDEAKEQVTFEYGEVLSAWKEAPFDIADVCAFGFVP